MRTKLKFWIFVSVLLDCSVVIYAGNGIKRSEWNFRPEITTGNVVYALGGMIGSMLLDYKISDKSLSEDYNPSEKLWWLPQFGLRTVFLSEADYAEYKYNKDVKGNYFDWTDPGYSIGYAVNYTSKQVPFGFRAKVSYDHQNFKSKPKGESSYTSFSKDMIVPEVDLKILFGSYRTSESMFILSLGASYDYAINAKGLYNDKKTVNSGFSGRFGLELANPSQHYQFGAHYIIPFYDYFNKDYSPDGGRSYPYEDAKTKMYIIMEFFIRLGF